MECRSSHNFPKLLALDCNRLPLADVRVSCSRLACGERYSPGFPANLVPREGARAKMNLRTTPAEAAEYIGAAAREGAENTRASE